MMITERIQTLIHKIELDTGARKLNYIALTLAVIALAVWYDTHCYRNFSSPEAMDLSQVARNISEGKGYTTEFVRPFSIYLLQNHNRAVASQSGDTNLTDYACVYSPHPDLANAPVYPFLLAGVFKLTSPDWNVNYRDPFWSNSGHFIRYKPEFLIAVFNQFLLLGAVLLAFRVAKIIFDGAAAWLIAILMLGSDLLWKYSISGLPTMLLLIIFLGLVWCLVSFEVQGQQENPNQRRRFMLAVSAGVLVGLGMLTRYSFGWVIMPVVAFFVMSGGLRRTGLALTAFLVFVLTVSPWVVRNLVVSGTFLGTAGYALFDNSYIFPGAHLMQSITPEMSPAYRQVAYIVLVKLQANLRLILQDEIPHLGGSWMGILFMAGLLFGMRNNIARRLRYFTLMCLGVFLLITPLGATGISILAPDINTENQLVLLTPLVMIFGVAFFLTLLDQMNCPTVEVRFGVVGLVVVLCCQQFILTLLPPKTMPGAYPPYYPPEIQEVSGWMGQNEMLMSDVPWAVAWYGDRQCAWTTINSQYEFSQFDFVKPVHGLYLTLNTLNAKLFTECLQGGVDSWGNFVLRTLAANEIPDKFPLRVAPQGLYSGLFLTDRQRWPTQ